MSVDDERCYFVLIPLDSEITIDGWMSTDPAARNGFVMNRFQMVVGLAGRKPGEVGWTHPEMATLIIGPDAGRFDVEHGDIYRSYHIPDGCLHEDPRDAAECLAEAWLNAYETLTAFDVPLSQ